MASAPRRRPLQRWRCSLFLLPPPPAGLNLHDLAQQTLVLLEKSGGAGAAAAIKQHVPTYESAEEDLHRGFR